MISWMSPGHRTPSTSSGSPCIPTLTLRVQRGAYSSPNPSPANISLQEPKKETRRTHREQNPLFLHFPLTFRLFISSGKDEGIKQNQDTKTKQDVIHPIVESPIFKHFGYPLEVELLVQGYRKGFLGVLQLSQSTLALLSEQVKVFPPCSLLPAPCSLLPLLFSPLYLTRLNSPPVSVMRYLVGKPRLFRARRNNS